MARSISTNTKRAKASHDHFREAKNLLQGSRQHPAWLFLFERNFFLSPLLAKRRSLKKKKILSRVCVRARFVENNNSLELYFIFRNTLVFLFIKRKVSEEMHFSSEVWVRNSDNFRKNGNNFGRNRHNFGSYYNKWVRNFDPKTPEKCHF